jgi:2-oxoglutarate dehydrogenase E2 component (dihydrolipoamide succinyltransferase)
MAGIAASSPDGDDRVTLSRWLRPDGAVVAIDEPIRELETGKATVELAAHTPGVLRQRARAGDVVTPNLEVARIDPLR